MGKFELFVDDNYHHMDKDERYLHGTYETYEEAVAAAKKIIDDFLAEVDCKKLTAEELFSGWAHYGDSPFIVGDVGKACEDEVLERGKAIVKEMKSRQKAHGSNLAEMLKPMDLPPPKLFFSASAYVRERCRELCSEAGAGSKKG